MANRRHLGDADIHKIYEAFHSEDEDKCMKTIQVFEVKMKVLTRVLILIFNQSTVETVFSKRIVK